MTLRVFAAGISTETNVFSPMPTGRDDFQVAHSDDPEELRDLILGGTAFARFASVAASHGCDYVQGLYAGAQPAGVTPRAVYEELRGLLLHDLERALPVDCVLLDLHGAMVAEGYEDCETDLAQRVRRLAGPDAKIAALFDLHCDLPEELLEAVDVLVIYKEYPHIDIDVRAEELARLVIAAARGDVSPTMAVYDCKMIGLYPTPPQPMRAFVDRMSASEGRDGILSVSLGHGFPWGDAPGNAARVLVVADGDAALAREVAAELGEAFFALRHEVGIEPLAMPEALDRAFAAPAVNRPVVVADVADNAGGGAASDSTFALRELLERKVERTAIALIWEPIAVHQAFAAGNGANLILRLGGKMGADSGDPLDLRVQVCGLVRGLVQRWPQTDGHLEVPCGDCAHLRCDGIDVIVGSLRHQVLGLEVFTAFDIEPSAWRVLVVKSANHFRAAFEPIASEVLYMSAPGALSFDFGRLPYRRLDRHVFPLVDDPFAGSG